MNIFLWLIPDKIQYEVVVEINITGMGLIILEEQIRLFSEMTSWFYRCIFSYQKGFLKSLKNKVARKSYPVVKERKSYKKCILNLRLLSM